MKKLFLILALAIGLGAASPQKASAQEIVVTTITHFDGYDYVEFNDGSFGLFLPMVHMLFIKEWKVICNFG